MKRVLAFLLLAVSLTGCAVRVHYYDPYYHHWRDRDHYYYERR